MSMNVVIPLGPSKMDHVDLRYVLRSMEKHLSGFDDILIVGQLPDWIHGVMHMDFDDDPDPRWKEKNIFRKLKSACLSQLVSDHFFMINDDHVLLSDTSAAGYPFYYKGTVTESWESNRGHYKKTMNHTRKLLHMRGFPDRNFDTHTPIVYEKKRFLNSFGSIDFSVPYGYGIKTLYCATNRISGEYMPDCKFVRKNPVEFYDEFCKNRSVISFDDSALKGGLMEYLKKTFPHKSSYEK